MSFLVKGNLNGALGRKTTEPLEGVLVKIYLAHANTGNRKTSITGPRQVPQLLENKAVASKNKFLIGQGSTDAQGAYEVRLSPKYNGGPIEIDVEVREVPKQKRSVDKTVQFTIKKLQPVWRGESDLFFYSYNYCLPYQFWSGIRSRFDAWLLYGFIRSAQDNKTPLVGVEVLAYDTDWIKDDFLGTATTDSSGRFRIDYSSTDFKKTFLSPLVNVETPLSAIPGPGVYFKVVSTNGKVLYEEDRSCGKAEDRRDIPHCFCIDLYISDKELKTS